VQPFGRRAKRRSALYCSPVSFAIGTPVIHQHRGSETFDIADAGPGEVHNPDCRIVSCAVAGLMDTGFTGTRPITCNRALQAACVAWEGARRGITFTFLRLFQERFGRIRSLAGDMLGCCA
jgi:hypothetical protein